jgi:pectate lyase
MRISIVALAFTALVSWGVQASAQSQSTGGPTGVGSAPSNEHTGTGGGNNSHLLLIDDGRVYPNPSSGGGFSVDLTTSEDRIVVLNSLGQSVPVGLNSRNSGRTVDVTIPQYTPGIYFVRIQHTDNRTTTHRLLVR